MIDGMSIELIGINFSMLYAAEVSAGLVSVKFALAQAGISALITFDSLIFLSFLGRINLSRFLIRDAVNLILGAIL